MRNKDIIVMEAQLQVLANDMLKWDIEKGLRECRKAINLLLLAKTALKDLEKEDIPLLVNALEDAEQYIEGEVYLKGVDPDQLDVRQIVTLKKLDEIIEKLKRMDLEG
jgi:hypothetical protein